MDLKITFKPKKEIKTCCIMGWRFGSIYRFSTDTAELVYWNNIDKNLAFKALINDLNHETTHSILHHFIDKDTSKAYDKIKHDNLKLQIELHIGYNDVNEFLNINKQIQEKDFSF